jgi:toxin ParE1/3/4
VATGDLQSVWEFISDENESAADQVIEHISFAVEQLQRHPRLGRPGRLSETRELSIIGTPYLIAYRVVRQEIQILAVLHGARRWPDSF